jgi:hypothetical protein
MTGGIKNRMDYILTYLPLIILLIANSFTLLKYDRFTQAGNKLGQKIGTIKDRKSIRLFFIIPFYFLICCYAIYMIKDSKHLILLNSLILLLEIILIIVFEYKLYICTKAKGVYENGICYTRGSFLFKEIPEISIKDKCIEILNEKGFRETFFVDEKIIEYLQKRLEFKNNKVINNEWSKNRTSGNRTFRNAAGRITKY